MLLHEILNQTCERVPENIAIESKNGWISYQQLGDSSDFLSNKLKELGLQSGDNIAVLLPKSILAVVSFFSCLKSGGCYIPLDTSAPKERLSYIIESGQARFVLTDNRHFEQALAMISDKMTVILLEESYEFGQWDVELKEVRTGQRFQKEDAVCEEQSSIDEDSPAYLLYTSGSTGKPKGVTISHRNAFCFVHWAYEYFQVTSDDILSSHAPFYFDLSVFDIYVTIMAGAKLCLLPTALSAFPASLVKYIKEHQITIWYSVPSILVKMLQYGSLAETSLDSLRCIIYAGEAFPIKYLKECIELISKASFYNLYGPTETNVITYYHVKSLNGQEAVPIGSACPYCKIYIVKEDGTQAKVGERGELVVQSESLMKGYYRRDDLTKQVIGKLTLDGISYDRCYHTGDMVEVVEDGTYRFLCRIDHMVKLGGFRVELEEIEAVLCHHPKIAACMARVESEPSEHLQVIVQGEVSAEEVIQYAKQYLPEYMVPYEVHFTERFHYTERGKIDRHAEE